MNLPETLKYIFSHYGLTQKQLAYCYLLNKLLVLKKGMNFRAKLIKSNSCSNYRETSKRTCLKVT